MDILNQSKAAWQDGIVLSDRGKQGQYLTLRDPMYDMDDNTDLLIHFDGGEPGVRGGYQTISFDGFLQEDLAVFGDGGALFLENSQGLVLEPNSVSMFRPGSHLGSFTIEFWFYSGAPREGGEVFSWQGSSWVGDQPLFQQILAKVEDRRLTWNMQNFFVRGEVGDKADGFTGLPVTLRQRRELIPRRWSHHMLRYNPSRNILEYLVDGISEAILHVTEDGRENGNPFTPFVGELSEPAIRLGNNLNGALDEFRISTTWREPARGLQRYMDTGRVIFEPYDLYYPGARVLSAEIDGVTPGATEVRVYYFLSDLLENPRPEDSRWSLIAHQGEQSLQTSNSRNLYRGRYLYTMVELLPDGVEENRPGIEALSFTYEPDMVPPAPRGLRAGIRDGKVVVEWNPVLRGNPEGYLVLFGTRPNEYFGESVTLGDSPINVGDDTKFELDGLSPGIVYYIRVGSYNYSNNPNRGVHIPIELSEEIRIRAEG